MAEWSLLPHFLRSGIWHYQFDSKTGIAPALAEHSPYSLGIETGLHYRRDVTLKEDATRMTSGDMGKVMASINNLILALIRQAHFHNAAQARRWFAAHPAHTFALLTTPFLVLEKAMFTGGLPLDYSFSVSIMIMKMGV